VIQRALDDAFRLADPAEFPRTKAAFTERLAAGKVAFPGLLGPLGRIAVELGAELEKVRALVKALTSKPGAPRVVVDDVTAQLAHLAPPDLMRVMSLTRLGHILRYLKAVQVRLQRQAYDPPKDQQKAALVAPFWKNYLTRRDELRARSVPLAELHDLEEFGWLVEELRVQTFAPELKTAVPISAQRLADLWATLPR
jgi:ATP-dependent helicase HrpA